MKLLASIHTDEFSRALDNLVSCIFIIVSSMDCSWVNVFPGTFIVPSVMIGLCKQIISAQSRDFLSLLQQQEDIEEVLLKKNVYIDVFITNKNLK